MSFWWLFVIGMVLTYWYWWVLALVIVVCLGNGLGWLTTARRDGDPFNWRVFLGPWLYARWAERRSRQQ
jgi:hypothetical protein